MARLSWLPDVLRSAGLDVLVYPGWTNRGRGNVDPQVVVCHHTASSKTAGEFPSLKQVAERGNPGVSAPLAQLMLGRRTGRWYVIASGVSNNAGSGGWAGYKGNWRTIGIEAEHSGISNPADPRYEEWTPTMYDSYARGVAAILEHVGHTTDRTCGHKEWAPARKIDPTFGMPQFRRDVDLWRGGMSPVPSPTTKEPPMIVPCMYPPYKAGPRPEAGNRVAYYTHYNGSELICWNGAAVGDDLAWPYRPLPGQPQMSSDEASMRGLTFRYLTLPIRPGHRLVGVSYYPTGPGTVDVSRITAYASDGGTFTVPAT